MLGGVDFILHLLSSIPNLPVTKDIIKDSGLGKAVGSIEKHSSFRNSPNLNAVASRVQKIKDSWHARVKAQKMIESVVPNGETSKPLKRPAESSAADIQAKKTKASVQNEEPKKVSAFSSLLKKVNPSQGFSSSPSKDLPMESKVKVDSITETENVKNEQKSTFYNLGVIDEKVQSNILTFLYLLYSIQAKKRLEESNGLIISVGKSA